MFKSQGVLRKAVFIVRGVKYENAVGLGVE